MKTKNYLIKFLISLLFMPVLSFAQGVAINSDDSEADPSAMLDIKSSDKGLLIPRMSQAEIESIPNPANGLWIFNTTDDKFYIYVADIFQWQEVAYGTETIAPAADYSIGIGSSCNNTIVYGDYKTGQALTATEFVTIEVDVTEVGSWWISTNTINGYSFSANGVFTSTGIQTVDIFGSGTPVDYQTDNFTATASYNGGTCSFDIIPNITCGNTLTDARDGQNYSTIQIGTQCWMQENLNIGTQINGNSDQTDNGTIEKYCFGNNSSNCNTYGGLYQWNEIMEYSTTEGAQGICPTGWHIPTDNEWCTLELENDATIVCNTTGWRGIIAGGTLKETGTTHWISPNTGTTNSSGFTALGSGYRDTDLSFYNQTYTAHFWSSSENGSSAFYRYLSYNSAQSYRDAHAKGYGTSVRCIQDEANINQAPSQPTSPSPTDASADQAINSILSWTCSDPDGDPLTYDIYFGETNPPALVSSGQYDATYDMGVLNNNATYYWKITAYDNYTNSTEGVVWSFTTGTFGEVYNPATGETWMDRNLGASQVATSSTDAAGYGDLYQWGRDTEGHEIRTSGTTSTIATTAVPSLGNSWNGLFITSPSYPYPWLTPNDNSLWQGLSGANNPCPAGFRIPTESEWETERQSWPTNDGAGAFASPLKLTLTGYRDNTGFIPNAGNDGNYWSSTVSGNDARSLNINSGVPGIYSDPRVNGFSIRCIKD